MATFTVPKSRESQVATLAGKLLPLVQAHPDKAYPMALSRMIEPDKGTEIYYHESLVGYALRFMKDNGLVTSEKLPNPSGQPGSKVTLYKTTQMGTFMLALAKAA